ncbi:YciI family protein [soil metagenome]
MKEYLMLFRNEKNDGGPKPSDEQMRAAMLQWQKWIKGLVAQGNYSGTNRLYSEGKTLKPNNVIADGPFAEVKEMVGGYVIVKANSLEEAVDMAKGCPNLLYGGNVEVRAVMPIEYNTQLENFLEVI